MSSEDHIHELNDLVGRKDFEGFTERMQPEVVWEHNIDSGSPEEGVYEGREQVKKLFERVLEGWEYMRPEALEIDELEPGVYAVRGKLHCKIAAAENVIVEQYEQRIEFRDGLMVRGRMTIGTTTHG